VQAVKINGWMIDFPRRQVIPKDRTKRRLDLSSVPAMAAGVKPGLNFLAIGDRWLTKVGSRLIDARGIQPQFQSARHLEFRIGPFLRGLYPVTGRSTNPNARDYRKPDARIKHGGTS